MNPAPNTQKQGGGREAVPVKSLRMVRPTDFPGNPAADTITTTTQTNVNRYEIEYQPWLRHHRVTWHAAGAKEPRVGYVHESSVAYWEPL
jgi:hypothetical protein